MAADFKIAHRQQIGVIPVTQTGTFNSVNAPPFPFGQTLFARDFQTGSAQPFGAAAFVMCKGSDVTQAGRFVHIQGNTAILLNENNSASKFPVGVAAGALSASNVYGFVQVAGLCDYAQVTNSSIAAGVPLYVHTNSDQPGYLVVREGTETVHLGHMVLGVVAPTAMSSSATNNLTVQLDYPMVVGLSASV